jgi:hypothetical protein
MAEFLVLQQQSQLRTVMLKNGISGNLPDFPKRFTENETLQAARKREP